MSSKSLVERIDNEIKNRSLLKHPFYQKWNNGELTEDHLRGYSKEYFSIVKAIPDLVSNTLGLASRNPLVQTSSIRRNLLEERDHIDLWLRFCNSLGLQIRDVREYDASLKSKKAIGELNKLTSSSLEEAVAALYSYEDQLPRISSIKIQGLKKFYNLRSRDSLIYFETHQKADVRHAKVWRKMLGHIEDKRKQESAFKAAIRSLEAQQKLLDSVMERYVN
jgi:pyrroloquinoline-quinone synthase